MTIIENVGYTIVSNNAPADTAVVWDGSTQYQPKDAVRHQDKIYWALKENTNKEPDKSPDEWMYYGLPNELKFKDEFINTQTKSNETLTITIDSGANFVNSFVFLNIDGKKISVSHNDMVIFEKELTRREYIDSWWQYFYGGEQTFSFLTGVWFVDHKNEYRGQITIKIEHSVKGANIGHIQIGRKFFIGHVLLEPQITLLDYSKKVKDEWGRLEYRDGLSAKYIDFSVVVKSDRIDAIREKLEKNRGLIMFLGDEREKSFKSLNIYGFYRDMTMVINNLKYSEINVSVEGVI